ncbi:hypothetical protein [Pseudarthrobacter sp. ATCC 49987]|uniref:hypothetical protein n=1 Tax=Pseudarthrobacter sp. ATCC 49987 TaxID=2698204 RepID=UPI00136C730F|nr:hypothetical protein [Pseudarthrobacter sp. ATCC 49987]
MRNISLAPSSNQVFTFNYQFQPQDPAIPGSPVQPASIRHHLDSAGTVTEYTAAAGDTP